MLEDIKIIHLKSNAQQANSDPDPIGIGIFRGYINQTKEQYNYETH